MLPGPETIHKIPSSQVTKYIPPTACSLRAAIPTHILLQIIISVVIALYVFEQLQTTNYSDNVSNILPQISLSQKSV